MYFISASWVSDVGDVLKIALQLGAVGLSIVLSMALLFGLWTAWRILPKAVESFIGSFKTLAETAAKLAELQERTDRRLADFDATDQAQTQAIQNMNMVLQSVGNYTQDIQGKVSQVLDILTPFSNKIDEMASQVASLITETQTRTRQESELTTQVTHLITDFSTARAQLEAAIMMLTSVASRAGKDCAEPETASKSAVPANGDTHEVKESSDVSKTNGEAPAAAAGPVFPGGAVH